MGRSCTLPLSMGTAYYVSRTSFWGNEGEVDGKGRVLIPPELRTSSKLDGNVRIIGKIDHMVLWNEDEFRAKALSGEFSDEKLHQVSLMLNEIAAVGSKE